VIRDKVLIDRIAFFLGHILVS